DSMPASPGFVTVTFTTSAASCTDGTVFFPAAISTNQTNAASTNNQVVGVTSGQASINADSTPPTSTITFPADGAFYNNAGWTGTLTGTANDPGVSASGLASVGVSVKNLSTNLYWNGSTFSSVTEVFNAASGTSSWTLGLAAAALTNDVQYTVRSQATDNAGNVQTTPASATFTYDTAPPTSSISF